MKIDFLGLKTPIEKCTTFQKTNIVLLSILVIVLAGVFVLFWGVLMGETLKYLFFGLHNLVGGK